MSVKLTFLGTGGGRHATIYQTRSTGGMIVDCGQRIQLDPGPGALVNMRNGKLDPADTDVIMVSHCHPDHYSDAEVLIEGMCKGGSESRGMLIGSMSVIDGFDNIGPCISNYHKRMAGSLKTIIPGDELQFNDVRVEITKSIHNDPTTVGFKFHTPDGIISYVSDTSYSDEIADQYVGSRILILPITTPDDRRIAGHLCTEDAIPFVNRVKPELTIFNHMGIYLIKLGPDEQTGRVSKATGYTVIAGTDLMTIEMEEDSINVMQRQV